MALPCIALQLELEEEFACETNLLFLSLSLNFNDIFTLMALPCIALQLELEEEFACETAFNGSVLFNGHNPVKRQVFFQCVYMVQVEP